MTTVGLVHPGRMGAAVGRELTGTGVRVVWCTGGRSEATARRADEAGLDPVSGLAELAASSDLVVSLCPPAAAEEVAVAALFAGTAVEAVPVDGAVGQASALKMAFGSFNKASAALAAVSHALADALAHLRGEP